jgi:hypothetical protein
MRPEYWHGRQAVHLGGYSLHRCQQEDVRGMDMMAD